MGEKTFLPGFGRAVGRGVIVLLIFTLITALFFWPILPHLSNALLGPPEDNLNDFWNSWYVAVAADPKHFFYTELVRHPEGANLYFHDFAYPQIFVVTLLSRIFGTAHSTLVLLQNLSLLASFPLAGLGGYYLVRHFTAQDGASLVGGFIFAFNPWHVAQALHHMGIAQIEFFPFFVLAWIYTIDRKSVGWLATAILLYALAALCCWYYVFYGAFFVLFHTIFLMQRDNVLPKGWQLAAPLLCFTGTALLLSPLIIPMLSVTTGTELRYGGNNFFVADLTGYILFPPPHILSAWSADLFKQLSGNEWEVTVYLGLINIALLVWFVRRKDHSKMHLKAYVFSGIIAFAILASGDTLHIAGKSLTFLSLPNVILSKLPLASSMRTPSRIIVLVYLFVSLGVGCQIAQLTQQAKKGWQQVGLGLLVFLIVLDFYPTKIETTDATCPAALNIIAKDNTPGISVLDLPLSNESASAAMFRQSCHGKPILVANLSRILTPSLIDAIPMNDLAQQQAVLRQARTKYIVINNTAPWQTTGPDADDYRMHYTVVAKTENLTILRTDGAKR